MAEFTTGKMIFFRERKMTEKRKVSQKGNFTEKEKKFSSKKSLAVYSLSKTKLLKLLIPNGMHKNSEILKSFFRLTKILQNNPNKSWPIKFYGENIIQSRFKEQKPN